MVLQIAADADDLEPQAGLRAPEFAPPPAPSPTLPLEPAKDRSFASLFGWKAKPADELAAAPVAKPVSDDDAFDDELEIPAFLRRSANT